MKRSSLKGGIIAFMLITCGTFGLLAQETQYHVRTKALNAGVYDHSKVKKNPYRVYYDQEADQKFEELLMSDERLKGYSAFGQYLEQEDGSIAYVREQEACEYCPGLEYVIVTGGHGYVSAYDLNTLEEIFVNPSSHVYSPSGKFRFGFFEFDGMRYYIDVEENGVYIPCVRFDGKRGDISDVYWADDETMHFLREKERPDGSKYWAGYSIRVYEAGGK